MSWSAQVLFFVLLAFAVYVFASGDNVTWAKIFGARGMQQPALNQAVSTNPIPNAAP